MDNCTESVPVECLVTGRLKDVRSECNGTLRLTRTDKGWVQDNDDATTRHLRREYVGRESLDTIMHNWLSVDFSSFDVEVTRCGPPLWHAATRSDTISDTEENDVESNGEE
jgi:hypothetical protein